MSTIASAAALWWPENVIQAVARSEAAITSSRGDADLSSRLSLQVSAEASTVLPASLPVFSLEKADFDPFLGLQPPPPPPPKVMPAPVVVAPPPPAPMAPVLTYRYLGQMIDPSGKRLVYLGKADKDVSVVVGTQLDEGYVVDAITANGVEVRYPSLDVRAVIMIPSTSDAAVR